MEDAARAEIIVAASGAPTARRALSATAPGALALHTLRLDTQRYAERWRGPADLTPGSRER